MLSRTCYCMPDGVSPSPAPPPADSPRPFPTWITLGTFPLLLLLLVLLLLLLLLLLSVLLQIRRPDLCLEYGNKLLAHGRSLGDELWVIHEQASF